MPKAESSLRIGHLNIYHLVNKVTDVCVFLNKQPQLVHLFGVSETRLDSRVSDSLIDIPNYSVLRRDSARKGQTGLALYVHRSIASIVKRRADLEDESVECLWVELKNGKSSPLLICYIYRNPAETTIWIDNFVSMMDKAKSRDENLILLGDFNINVQRPQKMWGSTTALFGLHQLVKTPTRETNNSSTLIDHIYTDDKTTVSNVQVVHSTFSDHYSVFCSISLRLPKLQHKGHTTIEYRSFKHFDESAFFCDLNRAPFQSVFNCNNADDACNLFLDIFCSIIDKHAPLRQHRVKHPHLPPWLTSDIIEAMALRDYFKEHKMKNEYNLQRNVVLNTVRQAKAKYFNKLLSDKKDTATIWRAMNEVLDKSRKKSTNCPSQITPEDFNRHFISLAEKLKACLTQNESLDTDVSLAKLKTFCGQKLAQNQTFHIPAITVHEVGKLIEQMANKKSMGPDKIPVRLLKLALPYIIDSLTFVYNLSIQQNVFPSVLKCAKVVPLPKNKDLTDPNNFRPISLLPVLSKPLEKHIQKHLLEYIERMNLFHPFQSGFRPKHSCHTALSSLCETWLSAINEAEVTGALFLDFKKAFDLVDHSLLLKKLQCYLKDDSACAFFESYLSKRTQYVSVNCNTSSTDFVKSGVPQGSILGPILFCIYINDLPLHVSDENVICEFFADDSSVHTSQKSLESVNHSLQKSIEEISEWCTANTMIMHPIKTKSMVITTRQKHQLRPLQLELSVGSTQVQQVKEHTILGVTVDQELKWQTHLNKVCKVVSKNLYLLSKLRHYADLEALKLFYYAHIMPHINYASTLWDNCSDVHLKRLNSLHRRAAKLILHESNKSTDEKLKLLNFLPLKDQLTLNKAVLMYKVMKSDVPGYLQSHFSHATKRYGSQNLIPPIPRLDLYKSSLAFSGTFLWNSIPIHIRNTTSVKSFRRQFHSHLMCKWNTFNV